MRLTQAGEPGVAGTIANSQVNTRLTFVPDDSTVVLNSDINVMDVIGPNDLFINTYELSVSATASIRGKYTLERDGDDYNVIIAFVDTTLAVDVDPQAVTFNTNALTGKQQPELDTLRPHLAQNYCVSIRNDLHEYYSNFQHLEDVRVKDNILSLELADRDCTFRRVAEE